MTEAQIVTEGRRKRDDIKAVISRLPGEDRNRRADLSIVAATLRLFELGDQHEQFPAHLALGRFFKREKSSASARLRWRLRGH